MKIAIGSKVTHNKYGKCIVLEYLPYTEKSKVEGEKDVTKEGYLLELNDTQGCIDLNYDRDNFYTKGQNMVLNRLFEGNMTNIER